MANAKQKHKQKLAGSGGASVVRLMERGGEGSLLSVKPPAPSTPGRKKIPKPRRGGKRSPRTQPPPIEPPRVMVEDVKVLLQRLNTWEKLLKSHREDQDGVEAARTALRCACVELVNAYPKTAQKLRVSERLWKSWYDEISKLQALRGLAHKEELAELLSSCSVFYTRLVEQLRGSLRRPNRSPEHQEGLKDALQMALVALGDVARYRIAKSKPCDWTEARDFYQQALEVAPSNGKVYNQLGLLAVRERKLLDGAYLYARSLVCAKPFTSTCNLLHVLQPGRSAEKQPEQCPSGGSTCEAMTSYSALVRSCLHVLVTGKDSKQNWNDVLKRVQVALRQLLKACDPQDDGTPADSSFDFLSEALSTTLLQVVCLAIVSVHSAERAIGQGSDRQAFDEAFTFWSDNELTINALDFGCVTLACLVSKLISVLSDSAESARAKHFINALLPAINVYLDWLHLHPALLGQLNVSAAGFQDDCVNLYRILSAKGFVERGLCCSRNHDGDLSSAVLPEDRELFGFLPYEKAHGKRFAPASGNGTPQRLSAEELLVLRTTRFMTLSESYVFSGQSKVHSSLPSESSPGNSIPKRAAQRHKVSFKKCSTAAVDPFAVAPVLSGRLCVSCSNTSTFVGGECEFCGYEDDDEAEDTLSDDVEYPVDLFSWSTPHHDASYTNNDSSPGRSSAFSPLRHHSSPVSSASSPHSELSSSPSEKLEADFRAIMSIGAQHAEFHDGLDADKCQQQLIVIDAPNVAMRHGKGKVFSCAGIELSVKYFRALGHRVVAFMPDYMLQSDEERAQHEEQGGTLTAAKIPDDVELLERMVNDGVLVPTPSQDYDDSYSIQYAGLHDGCVVTNDLFRDHIENMVGPRERKVAMRAWLRAHQISYSWVRNEFIPNPNFRFPEISASTF